MRRAWVRLAGLLVLGAFASQARAEQLTQRITSGAEENRYGQKGALEVGGAVDLSWQSSVFALALNPMVGTFFTDGFEVSGIFSFSYANVRTASGRVGTTVTSLLVEPSYHVSLGKPLFVFAGLGLGPGYDGTQWAFALAPRAGLNILLGQNAVFSPAIRVPIQFGGSITAALALEGAFTVVF